MEDEKANARNRMLISALLDRRIELEEDRRRIDGEMGKLRQESERLARELEVLEEMLGATRPDQRVSFASMPSQPTTFSSAPAQAPAAAAPARPRNAPHVRFRKGSVGAKLWTILQERYSHVEFGVDDVCELLKEQSPDTKHPYEASWRLSSELVERKVFLVTSQSKSGRGFAKRFRIADEYALPKPAEPKGIGLMS